MGYGSNQVQAPAQAAGRGERGSLVCPWLPYQHMHCTCTDSRWAKMGAFECGARACVWRVRGTATFYSIIYGNIGQFVANLYQAGQRCAPAQRTYRTLTAAMPQPCPQPCPSDARLFPQGHTAVRSPRALSTAPGRAYVRAI